MLEAKTLFVFPLFCIIALKQGHAPASLALRSEGLHSL